MTPNFELIFIFFFFMNATFQEVNFVRFCQKTTFAQIEKKTGHRKKNSFEGEKPRTKRQF